MTDRYAVIGRPIGHSKSPLIHSRFAQDCGQQLDYTAIEGTLEGFEAQVQDFRAAGGRGLNVTAPFKLRAFELAQDRSERATLAGAANALKFEGGRILAENFDGIGLRRDIEVNLGLPMAGRRVLMLGAGGAARGALLPFLDARPSELLLVNRDLAKAQALVEQVAQRGAVRAVAYADLPAFGDFDLVVNATSASLSGERPPIPASVFRPSGAAYELVYGKGLTPFLLQAHSAGVTRVADGVGMLVEQAAEAFAWWRGVRPDTAALIRMLTVPPL